LVEAAKALDKQQGILYIVATPIGNLADFSPRAQAVLQAVDFIACEDTRHSRALLERYAILKPLLALHEHNEDAVAARLLARVEQGESMALISDAGVPLVNDPGFPLVREAYQRGLRVTPIPGPCALIAALSACGLPTDRFSFEGFPPRTGQARRGLLQSLLDDPRTLIFYESSHRILEFIRDIAQVFPAERPLAIARELTKLHEAIVLTQAGAAPALLEADANMQRGEFVVLLQGAPCKRKHDALNAEQTRVLALLLEECSVKTAAALTAKITGARKDLAYQAALALSGKTPA
jgi:16S rRNA (cytidine1402-2'-O)-methyltransferase